MKGAFVAIDPGNVTGFAWVARYVRPERLRRILDGRTPGGVAQINGPDLRAAKEIVGRMMVVEAEYGLRAVAVEDFVLRKFTKARELLAPVRVTAMVVALADEIGVGQDAVWSYPTPGSKDVINDERLKRLGLWLSGAPHGRDALRHLVLALRRT